VLVLVSVPALLLCPVLVQIQDHDVYSDYPLHVKLAQESYETKTITTPHFLFALLTIAARLALPVRSFMAAGIVVGIIVASATAVLIYLLLARSAPPANDREAVCLVLFSLSLTVVAPITLFTVWDKNLYLGYVYPANVYHNPTILILKPLALLVFWLIVRLMDPTWLPGERFRGRLFVLGMLVVLATLAKPHYTMCLIAALPLAIGSDSKLRRSQRAWGALLAVVPTGLLVLAWQFAFLYGRTREGGIAFIPFVSVVDPWRLAVAKLMLSLAFPLAVYLLFYRTARTDFGFTLGWAAFITACFLYFGFVEEGTRKMHGNLGWGCQITLFVVFVYAAAYLLRQLRAPVPLRTSFLSLEEKKYFCFAIYMIHLVSGIIWYTLYFHDQVRGAWY
jgi:hypothetical protein